MLIPVEDEYEASKRRLQEFKHKIGIVDNKDDEKENLSANTFSLMGLVGISSINCNPKHTPGSC